MKEIEAFIEIISTKNRTDILKDSIANKLFYKVANRGAEYLNNTNSYQHLYILSNDVPKIGDYVLEYHFNVVKGIIKVEADDLDRCVKNHGYGSDKKVIASTDESLGLLPIPTYFIKDYVENNGSIINIIVEYDGLEIRNIISFKKERIIEEMELDVESWVDLQESKKTPLRKEREKLISILFDNLNKTVIKYCQENNIQINDLQYGINEIPTPYSDSYIQVVFKDGMEINQC